jgi:hypothetical protein
MLMLLLWRDIKPAAEFYATFMLLLWRDSWQTENFPTNVAAVAE